MSVLTAVGAAGAAAAMSPRDLQGVNFVSACGFSHRAMDDPIVFPGRPGLSHDHTFVGNATTDAFSTLRSLRAGATTCRRAGETAAYWMPTLLVDGQPVEPRGATIYYRRRTVAAVRPFPAGLRMIAGSSRATTPQGLRVTFWNCGAGAGVARSVCRALVHLLQKIADDLQASGGLLHMRHVAGVFEDMPTHIWNHVGIRLDRRRRGLVVPT